MDGEPSDDDLQQHSPDLGPKIHGSTLREIVKAAGVTTGALYHHFSGKDELFVEVCMEGIRNLQRRLDAAARLTDTRPLPERVIALFNAYATFYLEERGTFELLERLYVAAEQPLPIACAKRRAVY